MMDEKKMVSKISHAKAVELESHKKGGNFGPSIIRIVVVTTAPMDPKRR